MAEVDQELLAEMAAWKASFEAGEVRIFGLRKPKLEAGEHWSVRTLQVGSALVPRRDLGSALNRLGRAEGGAFATDRRVFVANGPKVKHEWRWKNLVSVHLLAGWQGVALETDPDSDQVYVVGTDRSRGVSGPSGAKAAAGWLQIEATFAADRGDLDGWMAALPARLADMSRGYDLPGT